MGLASDAGRAPGAGVLQRAAGPSDADPQRAALSMALPSGVVMAFMVI
jgi:hypothetical protein